MSKYHYNIEKKETKTNPGVINLTKVKKTETVDGGRKPPKVSLRDLFIQFMNKQEEFNKQVLNRLDNVDKRLDNVDKRLDSVEDVLQRNNLK
jgi:hypothetical protein